MNFGPAMKRRMLDSVVVQVFGFGIFLLAIVGYGGVVGLGIDLGEGPGFSSVGGEGYQIGAVLVPGRL